MKQEASAYYIKHPDFSWALFCITPKGDLFINSDWGTFGTAWRSFGDSFTDFLIDVNTDYLIGNFESNTNSTVRGSRPFRIRGRQAECIAGLFKELQVILKKEKDEKR